MDWNTESVMTTIGEPLAEALITWLPPEQGGRRNGPPLAPVYAATTAFADAGPGAPHEQWELGPHDLSILIEALDPPVDGVHLARIGFLAPDLAAPRVAQHDYFVVYEGPHRVATGKFTRKLVNEGSAN
jgi:hypothetical protein